MTLPAPAHPVVPVTLDLRDFQRVPRSTDECVALWDRLEPAVVTVDPLAGPRVRIDLGDEGEVGIWFLDPATAPRPLGPGTRFAIRGVLEPPEVRHACTTCRAAGTTTYAPYRCAGCDEDRRTGRVCEAHAVFLDGGLRASCLHHVPECRCGTKAAAWCSGVRCRGRRAWCRTHLRGHPADATVSYCADCYDERFPVCERDGCRGTGYIRCEHRTLSAMKACGRRVCVEHAQRWQVYGPYSRGVALCSLHHQELRSTPPEGLIDIILAGTVARAKGHRGQSASRRRVQLPRISIVRHILINTRRTVLDMEAIDRLFTGLEQRLRDRTPRDATVSAALELLAGHRPSRQEDIKRFREQHIEGRGHFDRLVQELRLTGRHQLADAVEFSDFRPRSRILFVKVPQQLQGSFIGTGGATIKRLRQRVGVEIKLERG
ncbi:KH domain-containing protein [Streptomyces sp. NPDC058440]|uniref:KH domain-containing protein n=1 Tax=Streptomyces sp. NPDC058440 TaxID=3346501 RepID=UPI0036607C10